MGSCEFLSVRAALHYISQPCQALQDALSVYSQHWPMHPQVERCFDPVTAVVATIQVRKHRGPTRARRKEHSLRVRVRVVENGSHG